MASEDKSECFVEKSIRAGKCELPYIVNTTHDIVINEKGDIMTLKVMAARSTYGTNGRYMYYLIRTSMDLEEFKKHTTPGGISHPLEDVDVSVHESPLRETGNVVADNEVTRALLAVISMTEDELRKRSGVHCHHGYRAKLIGVLDKLWD